MEETNKEEFTRVQRTSDSKYNYIGKDGKLLSEQWFKWADDFKDGFARVQREDSKYNYITKDGKIISSEWFDYVDYFYEYDFAVVLRTNGEWNFIDKTGKIALASK